MQDEPTPQPLPQKPRGDFVVKVTSLAQKFEDRVSSTLKEHERDLHLLETKLKEQQNLLSSLGKFSKLSEGALSDFVGALSSQACKLRAEKEKFNSLKEALLIKIAKDID